MRKTTLKISAVVLLWMGFTFCSQQKSHPVYMGTEMSSGYDLGVTTNKDSVGWLTDVGGAMKADYPAGQDWGSLFITVGKIKDLPNKPTVDLTGFQKLVFEIKSDSAPCTIEVGMKDAEDPDDGTESKVAIQVTEEWKSYEIDLSSFANADLKQIYILVEFIFTGQVAQSISVRNIQYK